MQTFIITITDTFGGEANFSWATRHRIIAKSERGAISKIARRSGLNFRNDGTKYLSRSGATCAFVEPADEFNQDYRFDTDEVGA
jgi:hypothetical protein